MMNEKDFQRLKTESPVGALPEEELVRVFEAYMNYKQNKITKTELTDQLLASGVSVDKFVTFYDYDRSIKITVEKAKELENGVFFPDDVRLLVVSVPKHDIKAANLFLDRFALEVLAKNGNKYATDAVTNLENWEKNHLYLRNNEDRSL